MTEMKIVAPMTAEEEKRLRDVEEHKAGMSEWCISTDKLIETQGKRISKMEAWKDKFFWVLAAVALGVMGQLVMAAMGLKK